MCANTGARTKATDSNTMCNVHKYCMEAPRCTYILSLRSDDGSLNYTYI